MSGCWRTFTSRSGSCSHSGSLPHTPRPARLCVPKKESVQDLLFESEASDCSAQRRGEGWSADASRFSSPLGTPSWSSLAAPPTRLSGSTLEMMTAAMAGGSSSSMSLDSSFGGSVPTCLDSCDHQAKPSVQDLLLGLVGSSLILQRDATSVTAKESTIDAQTSMCSAADNAMSQSSLDMISTSEPFSMQTSGAVLTEPTELTEGTVMTVRALQTEQAIQTEQMAKSEQRFAAKTEDKEGECEEQPDEQVEEGEDIENFPEQHRSTSAELPQPPPSAPAAQPPPAVLAPLLQSSKPSGVALACAGSNTDSGVYSESSDSNNKGISTLIPTGLPGIFTFPVAVMSPVALLLRSVIKDKSGKAPLSSKGLSPQFTGGSKKALEEEEKTAKNHEPSQHESEDEEDDLSVEGQGLQQGAVNPADVARGPRVRFAPAPSVGEAGDGGVRGSELPHVLCDFYDEASDELRPGGTPPMVLSSSQSSTFISSLPSSELSWDTPGSGFNTQNSTPNWSTEMSAWSTISQSRSSLDAASLASHSSPPEGASPTHSVISLPQPRSSTPTTFTIQQTPTTEEHSPVLANTIAEPWPEMPSPSLKSPRSLSSTLLMQKSSTSQSLSEKSTPVKTDLSSEYAKEESQETVVQSSSPLASRLSSARSSILDATTVYLGSSANQPSGMSVVSSKPSTPPLEPPPIFRTQSPPSEAGPSQASAQFATPPLSPFASPSASRSTSPLRSPSVAQSASPPSSASSPSPSQDFVQKISCPPEGVGAANTLFAALPAALRALEGAKAAEALGMTRARRDPDLQSIVEEDEAVSSGATSVAARSRSRSASSSGSSRSGRTRRGDYSDFGSIDVSYSAVSGMCCSVSNRDWSTETMASGSASEGEGGREEKYSRSPRKGRRCAHSAPASPHQPHTHTVQRTLPFVASNSASTVTSSKTGGTDTVTDTATDTATDTVVNKVVDNVVENIVDPAADPATDTVTGTCTITGSDSVLPLSARSSLSWESSPTWANGSGCVTSSEAFRKFLGLYGARGAELSWEADTSLEDHSTTFSASSSSGSGSGSSSSSSPSPSPNPSPVLTPVSGTSPNISSTVIV